MKKTWKCLDCGLEIENTEAPNNCGCPGEKGFKELEVKADNTSFEFNFKIDEINKTMKDMTDSIKSFKTTKEKDSAEFKSNFDKYDKDISNIHPVSPSAATQRNVEVISKPG